MRIMLAAAVLLLCAALFAQSSQQPNGQNAPPRSDQAQTQSQPQQNPEDLEQGQPLPRSDQPQLGDEDSGEPSGARPGVPPPGVQPDKNPNESSSRSAIIDLRPPTGDKSRATEDEVNSGVSEFKPWDPLKCAKDVEVGDYYFKQGNMKAAESRYREALYWKPGDAEATIRMARLFNKLGNGSLAQQFYQDYLKILPSGPHAKEAKEAIAKLQKESLKLRARRT